MGVELVGRGDDDNDAPAANAAPATNPLIQQRPTVRIGHGHDAQPRQRPVQPFFPHQWLDALDLDHTWLEAQVLAIDRFPTTRAKIHYKGFASRYDEWITTSTLHRTAPLHTHTRPPPTRHVAPSFPAGVGTPVDVLDTQGVWYAGVIVQVDVSRAMVMVHYLEWDAKFDEWLYTESYRLAPRGWWTANGRHQARDDVKMEEAAAPPARGATAADEGRFVELLQSQLQCTIRVQAGDGNCLFRSVAYLLYGNAELHALVRRSVVAYIRSDSLFFSGYISGESIDNYLARMEQDGVWGDNLEIQAISELYQRPVQIFAYTAVPMKTYSDEGNNAAPIRLSYHFRSHYNAVVPTTGVVPLLTSEPGTVEAETLRLVALRTRSMHEATTSLSDREATEIATLEHVMAASRRDFGRDQGAFDTAVRVSLESLAAREAAQLQQVVTESLRDETEDALLQQVKDLSAATALASEQKQEAKSNDVPDTWPAPVRACVEMGFPIDAALQAYTAFASDASPDAILQNMLALLQSP